MSTLQRRAKAFSLLELVIVLVIIGVIAAIAIPRITLGARGTTSAAIRHNLATLRASIDHYVTEHAGAKPTEASFADQMTLYTDEAGDPATAPDATHLYGPYLRAIPALPITGIGAGAGLQGATGVSGSPASDIAWLYDETTGEITANTGTATDENGKLFTDY